MTYEMKEGDIVIFRNREKRGDQPDYTGQVVIQGTRKRVALWLKESRKGTKFMSGEVSMKDFKAGEETKNELDDEVPF